MSYNRGEILYIDDDPTSLKIIGSYLEQEGYRALLAQSGAEGVEMFFRHSPDLVLLDLRMPGMNGFQVMERIKGEADQVPLLVISGVGEMKDVIQALRYGAWNYVIKSLDNLTLLGEAIEKAFRELEIQEEKRRYQQQLEQTMSESEFYRNQLETIFHSLPDGLLSVDQEGKVIKFNRSMEKLCPLGDKLECDKNLRDMPLYDGEYCLSILKNTLESGSPVLNKRVECPFYTDGSKVTLVTAVPVLNAMQRVSGATLVLKDISRQEALEEQLQDRREFKNMVGKSPQMQKLYTLIQQVASVDTTVLITGESGTGKECVVDALHSLSHRAQGPLRKVNCSALSEDLLDSELFGHVKGAFTGAHKDKMGRFEAAQGGTLFLDEIGEISHRIQLKLLRFLESKEFERVGSSKTIKADVRLISATNQDLGKRVREGLFRQDLYYRLKVMNIHIPSIRERKEDIPLLVEHFRRIYNREFNKKIYEISPEVSNIFMRYSWPGNVRELKHAMEHAALLCPGGKITTEHLPMELCNPSSPSTEAFPPQPEQPSAESFRAQAEQPRIDREAIERALAEARGNKSRAAALLGVHRKTLYRKIHQFGIAL